MLRKLKNFFHLLSAVAANMWYRSPSKKIIVIGVTGTDGKTTTVNLIHHLLTQAGYKAAVLSTLSSAHTTTPGSWKLQKFLSQSLKNGCTHVVLEVTSIAVDQYRILGIDFSIGVLTNTANNEHLDYHGTFEKYREAKIKFLLTCKTIIANADDAAFAYLKSKLRSQDLIAYQLADWGKHHYQTRLLGEFNQYNVLAAAAVVRELAVDEEVIKRAVASFKSPPGRLEIVTTKPFTVIVDFAHTPQAFDRVLPVVRDMRKKLGNKLIHVFGATGNRDRSKRPIMAKIAAVCDDYAILTHEDTYHENPQQIISEIEQGFIEAGYKNYEKIYDRRAAIEKALSLTKPGDVVILTGIGHQRSMNLAGHELPWNEPKIVKEILKKR